MMEIRSIKLEGSIVELHPMLPEHRDGLLEAGRHPEIWTVTQGGIYSLEDADRYIQKALGMQNAIPYVIVDKISGSILGSTRMFDISVANRNLEIGSTWLAPSAWRTAVNTECKYLLLRHGFEGMGAIRVQLKTDFRNAVSRKAIERLGARHEGVLRNHMILPDGRVRDSAYYSIIESEWPVVKRRLEELILKAC